MREHGFSLLEMLVVLAIMALMLSIISTGMARTLESARFDRVSEAAMADIRLLRTRAMLDKQPVWLVPFGDENVQTGFQSSRVKRLDLPEGWVSRGEIIAISSAGMCRGGQVSIESAEGRKAFYKLIPPRCEPERVPAFADAAEPNENAESFLDEFLSAEDEINL